MSAPIATAPLRVFTFGPAHGLPTFGPFGLKLEMALRLAGVPYERVIEDDHRKGPKRKSPWIEQGATRMGDTSLILQHLGIDLDRALSPRERAQGLVLRTMLEEHWHQVLEYELFVHPAGETTLRDQVAAIVPSFVAGPATWYVRRGFRSHLFERGIARHSPEEAEALGRADLDALAAWLDGREWAVGTEPALVDCSLFGLLAPAIYSPSPTPCFAYAKTRRVLVDFVDRARQRCFPQIAAPAVA
jgi:glutathione S-transferase